MIGGNSRNVCTSSPHRAAARANTSPAESTPSPVRPPISQARSRPTARPFRGLRLQPPELPRDAPGGGHDLLGEGRDAAARQPARGRRDAERRHDAAAVVADRRGHAANAVLELLVVHGVSAAADLVQRALQRLRRGDRRGRVARERSGEHVRARLRRRVREQHLAERRAVRRGAAPHPGIQAQRPGALHLADEHDLAAVEDREVHRLLDGGAEVFERGHRASRQAQVAERRAADLEDAQAQPVAAGGGIADQIAVVFERRAEPVHGALPQPEPPAQLGDARAARAAVDVLEDAERSLDRVDEVAPPRRPAGVPGRRPRRGRRVLRAAGAQASRRAARHGGTGAPAEVALRASIALTRRYTVRSAGAGTPARSAAATIAPVSVSISVGRPRSMSCFIEPTCAWADPSARCASITAIGSCGSEIPSAAATAVPSSTSVRRSAYVCGSASTPERRRPVSTGSGFTAELKISLAHTAPRGSSRTSAAMPARRSSAPHARASSRLARWGPSHVRPISVWRISPGPAASPAFIVTPWQTGASHAAAIVSALPSPFWIVSTIAPPRRLASPRSAARVSGPFTATSAWLHGPGGRAAGSAAAEGYAVRVSATSSVRTTRRSPRARIVSTCSLQTSSTQTSATRASRAA